MVYRYRDAQPDDDAPASEHSQLSSAYALCAEQLVSCEERAQFRRRDWPDSPIERPNAWTAAIQRAFEKCEVPGAISMVECTEYPCVAVLRVDDGEAGEAMEEQIEAALQNCSHLQQALGADELEGLVHTFGYDVPCGEGQDRVVAIAATVPGSDLQRALDRLDDPDDLMRWYFRRGEDVAAAWDCDED